ncbi:MAG: Rrf2 family transcriptional regulator [Oscillospiraceae bacterium]|nr:Rrf2 family transcriptional regulator [Oscillospiraceae bacterium]
MRISVKGRYALAAVVEIARNSDSGENVAVINIAGTLGISKIYLEQVFTQLKKAGILLAVKGSKGGYQLSRSPSKITAWEILSALESVLVEPVDSTVEENAPEIEAAMKELVFLPFDAAVREFLSGVTVRELLEHSEKQRTEQAFMLNM